MDALIDQINTKLGFNKIELVNDKEKVTNLSINNCNTGWKNFNTYTSLKSITLKNCIVDSDLFFNNLDNLEILRVDSNTYFKNKGMNNRIIKGDQFNKFQKDLLIYLENIDSVWEPSSQTTRKGFQTTGNLFEKDKFLSILPCYYDTENDIQGLIDKFFKNNNIVGIIDLSNACNDFFCYDLSICINAWCYENRLNIDKMKNLIKGYNSIRKIKIQEIKYLNLFLRASSLRFYLSRLMDSQNKKIPKKYKKNPKEYLKKLKYFQVNDVNNYFL